MGLNRKRKFSKKFKEKFQKLTNYRLTDQRATPTSNESSNSIIVDIIFGQNMTNLLVGQNVAKARDHLHGVHPESLVQSSESFSADYATECIRGACVKRRENSKTSNKIAQELHTSINTISVGSLQLEACFDHR